MLHDRLAWFLWKRMLLALLGVFVLGAVFVGAMLVLVSRGDAPPEHNRSPAEIQSTQGPFTIITSDGWGVYLPAKSVTCTLSSTDVPRQPLYDCPPAYDIAAIKEGREQLPAGAHYTSLADSVSFP
jgi:hypothetical protein